MGSMTEERIRVKLEEQLSEIYQQIGKTFYEEMKDVEIVGDTYRELFVTAKKINDTLDESMLTQQGKKRCAKCQAIVALESRFCNMCGEKLPEVTQAVNQDSVPQINKCSGCGTELEEDAVFCPNCGKKRV